MNPTLAKTLSIVVGRSRAPGLWLAVGAWLFCGVLSASAASSESTPQDGAAQLGVPILFTQVPKASAPPASSGLVRTESFEGARLQILETDGTLKPLCPQFHSACDPDVSFDAQRVLFAGKRTAADKWRIWQVNRDGSDLRAVSPDSMDARAGIFVSTLFTLDSPQPWYTAVFVGQEALRNESGAAGSSSLYNVKLDGTELRRMTFNPGHDFDPAQMWDGRVIYSAERWPVEPGAVEPGRVGLYAIHAEGADMEFYGGRKGARVQHMVCPTDAGLVLFVEPEPGAADGAGQLACVTERRPHVEYRRLTTNSARVFLYPRLLGGNTVVVASRPADRSATCGLYAFDADSGALHPVYDSPDWHDIQARPLRPRKSPDGHSTVVENKYTTGTFYALNSYDTDSARAPHLKAGTVKRVRFIEGVQLPAASPAAPMPIPRRLIGEAPVEADGSFNVEVPADTPLLLQTLDERGLALGNCGWVWVKPHETRGCIGCHEDPERIPENEYVLALRRPSTRLVLPPEQRRIVAFTTEIAPLLATRCAAADCHGSGGSTSLSLPLADLADTNAVRAAYEALCVPDKPQAWPARSKYIDPGRARTSPLIWQLFGEDTSRPWDKTSGLTKAPRILQMPPHNTGLLQDHELRTLIQWVDMGAPFEPPPVAGKAAQSP